jgi:LPXTG-motif cell wall-anchored protein
MKASIRRALCAVGLTGGIVLVGVGLAEAASADTGSGPVTTGESGIVSGNQTGADVQAPVNASGNQITVIGQRNHTTSTGSSSTGTSTSSGGSTGGSPTTSGQSGIGSGNQTAVRAQVPVNVSCNQVTVIGQDNASQCEGSARTAGAGASSGSPTTSGQDGIGSGNQTGVGVLLPINVSCNQVTVIGQDNASQCAGSSSASTAPEGSPTTTGQNGIVSGNQTGIGVLLPIDVSGNQVTVIGQDNDNTSTGGSSTGTEGAGSGGSGAPTTSGESGIGSGNQTGVDAQAPIDASGNQITVIGQDNDNTSAGGSSTGTGTGSTGETTDGSNGAGSGNQTPIDVQAPVDTTGNQVTVIGQDNTDSSTSGSTSGGTTPGGGTVSPPTAGQFPKAGGTATTVSNPQAAAAPGASVLPNTGLGGALPWLAALGLLLVGLGSVLSRRAASGGTAGVLSAVRAG